jgi:hypothetical protein
VVEPLVREGPALLGFVAARIAGEVFGTEAYHAERARQTEWLVERPRSELQDLAGSAASKSSLRHRTSACA